MTDDSRREAVEMRLPTMWASVELQDAVGLRRAAEALYDAGAARARQLERDICFAMTETAAQERDAALATLAEVRELCEAAERESGGLLNAEDILAKLGGSSDD